MKTSWFFGVWKNWKCSTTYPENRMLNQHKFMPRKIAHLRKVFGYDIASFTVFYLVLGHCGGAKMWQKCTHLCWSHPFEQRSTARNSSYGRRIEDALLLTTFLSSFCFNRLPFGISSAEIFQRTDDILIHGIDKSDMTITFLKSLKFLGHMISNKGIDVDLQKTDAIRKFPSPMTKKIYM